MKSLTTLIWTLALIYSLPATARQKATNPQPGEQKEEWTALFNGKDLKNWNRWLGVPHASVGGLALAKNDKGEYTRPLGLNKDPKGVYSVVDVDGAPAIRISGEIFGGLSTKRELEDFHVRAEFKWGEKKWPPREAMKLDSGLNYLAGGPLGVYPESMKLWMRSFQCQIEEQETGDLSSIAGTIADVSAEARQGGAFQYSPTGPLVKMGAPVATGQPVNKVVKSVEAENAVGKWNLVEVLCFKGTCLHVINGKVNMVAKQHRYRKGDREVPIRRGRIELQSEGAEVFFRNIAFRRLLGFPESFAAQMSRAGSPP